MQIFHEKVEIFCHKTYFRSVLHSFCTKLTEAATRPQHQTAAQPLTIHEDKRLNSKENAQGESGCAQEQEHTR